MKNNKPRESDNEREDKSISNGNHIPKRETNLFSFYKDGISNTVPSKEININDFIELLKKENKQIQKVRQEPDKDRRQKLKEKLSYGTFAGVFNKRKIKGLKTASGLACFDIDKVKNLKEIKEKLIRNKYTYFLFISPSGTGFKVVVKIPKVNDNEEYKKYWVSIARHYNLDENDEASKDISRACYISRDNEPYFNPNSEIYTDKVEDTSIIPTAAAGDTSKGKDTSRSGVEFRKAMTLFRAGKSRADVHKELLAYKKYADSGEAYQNRTLDNAEKFVLSEKNN